MPNNSFRHSDRWIIAAWCAVAGAFTWIAIKAAGIAPGALTGLGGLAELRVIALAAGAGGFVAAPLFGSSLPRAVIGVLLSTALGAAAAASALATYELGGFEGLALGAIAGPSAVFGAILQSPLVGGVWVLTMMAVQGVSTQVRQGSCDFP